MGKTKYIGALPRKLTNEHGENISVQNPLPTDGDSIYCKDVDVDNSDMGDFSGHPCDLVNDLYSLVGDDSSNNPKTLKLMFKRTVETNAVGIGCLDLSKSFSNVKLKFIDGSGTIRNIIDDSANNTKYNSFDYKLTNPEKFDGIIFEFHTIDTICLTNIVVRKNINVISRIQAKSSLTNEVENVTSYRGALDVNSAWVHRKLVNEYFHQHTATTTTPSIASVVGDISVTVNSVAGLVVGDALKFEENSTVEVGILIITDITGNVVTLDRPLANVYTTSALITKVLINMNVNGSLASPEIFVIDVPPATIYQLTRFLISITDGSPMDDGLFGSLSALTNGVTVRAITTAGRIVVLSNWKTNGDIKLDMYDVEYSDKAPAGEYGLRARWTLTKAEMVAEIDGDATPAQKIEILIQDDLRPLTSFRVKGQGRIFSP